MKKALLIILVLQFSIIYAQEFSLLDQGNTWVQRFDNPDCDPEDPYNPGCTQTALEMYRINGETTYEGLTYANVEFASNGDWYHFIFLREDEGIIYRSFNPQAGPDGDVVLYNFNLEVGDMIVIDSDDYCNLSELDDNDNGYADVIDVSIQFIAGENRKVITFDIQDNFSNFSDHQQWIEGIGSTSDFYFHFIFSCVSGTRLNCFKNNEEIFSFSESEDCNALLSTPGFSMTDQDNRWGERFYDGLCDPDNPDMMGCQITGLYGYRINGETVLNDKTYAIVERTINSSPVNWTPFSHIREEQGIVYTFTETEGERILYDFTLEIGDTIGFGVDSDFGDENGNGLADVTDVSTQFIAGQDRKVITFDIFNDNNFSEYEQWIEGLGSTNRPFSPLSLLSDVTYIANCFNNGNELFVFSENEEDCDSLLSVYGVARITTSLTPNPITEQATLTISTFQPNTTIAFYNILGQRISQKELTSNTTVIDRSDFPSSGMYFYQIQSEGKILDAQKFIVK